MGRLIVLDTNAVIEFLAGRLAKEFPDAPVAISFVTEIELLSWPKITPDDEAAVRRFLGRCLVQGISDPIKQTAIAVRRAHALRLPDALVAATALDLGAELATRDAAFGKVTGLALRVPPLRS